MIRVVSATLAAMLIVCAGVVSVMAQGSWVLAVPPIDQSFLEVAVTTFRNPATLLSFDDATRRRLERVVSRLQGESRQARWKILFESAIDESARVETWVYLRAFDSAAACEEQRSLVLNEMPERIDKFLKADSVTGDELEFFAKTLPARSARCVPATTYYKSPN